MPDMDRSVVVTGCGAGIGRAIFDRLARDGWSVAGVELGPAQVADARTMLSEAGLPGVVIEGDAADRDVLAAARAAAQDLAPLRGWVNNAAVVAQDPLHDPDVELVTKLFRLNVDGYYWGCSEAVRAFLAQGTGGAVVNISSLQAFASFPKWTAYAMTKAALAGLTRNIAADYGSHGIRANAVAPGPIWTPWNEANIARSDDPAAAAADFEALAPLGRAGQAPEIASVVSFLLSDEASYVTGVVVPVDGGTITRPFRYTIDASPSDGVDG
jgi:NAD(P)-dependent dehydrogenase (short-subunit alcohol dehydrogenase family)